VQTADFDYHLPPDRIAQRPTEPRDEARLMILDRHRDEIHHDLFRELPKHLTPGDILVINDTKVIPARIKAHKAVTGGKVELLLLKRVEKQLWEALVGGRGLLPGQKLTLEAGLSAKIIEDLGRSRRLIQFEEPISDQLKLIGEMPLPPYIHTPIRTADEYQTIFAHFPGSSAAPTAGLHFTPKLLDEIKKFGVEIARVTLHIGLDTFAPVTESDPENHVIHSEWCRVTEKTARAINGASGRIIAVGTTVVRVLETAALEAPEGQRVSAYQGNTSLFILPGFKFRAVDSLVTNFHLPRSTLLMMICAFAGRRTILDAYEEAKRNAYRFYSFGDAMLIL
jgi:S-adenosylmethionine:tRNA ribosyltransferase-isomerase